jgi:hypothetical protein
LRVRRRRTITLVPYGLAGAQTAWSGATAVLPTSAGDLSVAQIGLYC